MLFTVINFFHRMTSSAVKLRKRTILDLLEPDPEAKVLDLGCDDGLWTLEIGKKIGTKGLYGVDIVGARLRQAKRNGVQAKKADLNCGFPYLTNSFDVVHGDQIIEHISCLHSFASEVYRVLKPGGYIIISTENASSWHNIFASIMGWQIFSLTNMSPKLSGIGNPLAIHRGKQIDFPSWTHKTIFSYRGLIEFFQAYGFIDTVIVGAGYHPLPPILGKLDARHSHYITLKARKPKKSCYSIHRED